MPEFNYYNPDNHPIFGLHPQSQVGCSHVTWATKHDLFHCSQGILWLRSTMHWVLTAPYF